MIMFVTGLHGWTLRIIRNVSDTMYPSMMLVIVDNLHFAVSFYTYGKGCPVTPLVVTRHHVCIIAYLLYGYIFVVLLDNSAHGSKITRKAGPK